jgi:penicillin-binding protein 2
MSGTRNLKNFYLTFSTILCLILVARFAQLQLFERDRYFYESERNRIRDVVLSPPRGLIYDRHGEILVDNHPSYSVSVIPHEFLKSESTMDLLAQILREEPSTITARIRRNRIGSFAPAKVKRQVGFESLSNIEEHRLELPGVLYTIDSKRFYPGGVAAPHLFGYLGETTPKELEKSGPMGDYRPGDDIGKKGIELQYERYLRGKSGIKYVEVDVLGREVRDLAEFPSQTPESGMNLYLTIDATLQSSLEQAMADKQGAAIVLDCRDGDVLAMLSKPDYDPGLFSQPLTNEVWNNLVNHEGRPLYNRSCQSVYPPGSTYKLVLAAAGLETGKINLEEKIFCPGWYRFGRRTFDCWKQGGHGSVNLKEAIQQSCNVYFYTKGLQVGLEKWSKYSRLFGFGSRTEIDIPSESAGLVPDQAYLDKRYGVRGWTNGLLVNLSVGQGDLLTTPLQLATFAMLVGNEGSGFRPHVMERLVSAETGAMIEAEVHPIRIEGIHDETFAILKEGMALVVNGEKGTAKVARMPGMEVCGKTGTAQNPHGESHAWFIGFAPRDNPEIAFCILVENGGSGGAVAAPIAKGILRTYFNDRDSVKRLGKR